MTNAERLLLRLDALLDAPVDLTLYGRAALALGYPRPKPEFARSMDVDAVLWLGQAELLERSGNFWEALDRLNTEFEASGLSPEAVARAIGSARVPDSDEIREQLALCRAWLISQALCTAG